MEFIKNIDILSPSYVLKVDGKQRFQTVFGGLVTLICIVVLVILFFIIGENFYKKINPRILFDRLENKNPDLNITLNYSNFLIAFNTINYDEIFERPDIFYFSCKLNNFIIKSNQSFVEQKKVNYEKCSPKHIGNSETLYKKYSLSRYYCLNIDQMNVGGEFRGEVTNQIELRVKTCNQRKNSTINCVNSTEMLKIIETNDINLEMRVQKVFMDNQAKDNPISITFDTIYSLIDPLTIKKKYFYYEKYIYQDDKGILTPHIVNTTKIGYRRTRDDSKSRASFNINNIEYLYELNLYFPPTTNYIKRSYMSGQELIAQLGGMMKFFTTLGVILTNFYNRYYCNLSLINHIFDANINISKDELNKKVNIDLENKSFSLNQSVNRKGGEGNDINEKSVNQVDLSAISERKKVFNRKNQIKEKVSISISICNYFCTGKKIEKEKETLLKAVSIVDSRLDVFYIAKFFIDFDKFKYLLLNKHQYQSLYFLKKPNLYDKEDFVLNHLKKSTKQIERIKKELKNYFLNKNNNDIYDRKLLTQIDYI